MSDLTEYEFRAAPMRPVNTWTIKDGHVMRRGGSEAQNLSEVRSMTWGDMSYRATRAAWLDLRTESARFRITCSDNGSGRDRREFLNFVSAITDEVQLINPGVLVRIDGGAGFNTAMFIIGLIGAATGLFFVVAGVMDWVTRGNIMAIFGGGFFAALLGYLAWQHAPWKTAKTISLEQLKAVVSRL